MTSGEGVKNWDFYGDILFEWPQGHMLVLQEVSQITKVVEAKKPSVTKRTTDYETAITMNFTLTRRLFAMSSTAI